MVKVSQEIADKIKNEYFDWLYKYCCENKISNNISYKKLFMELHDITFDFYLRSDLNRAIDGTDLRYKFANHRPDLLRIVSIEEILEILDGPCSVLEMMLALAIRCEETIMDDPRYGNRTLQWFWGMLKSLGLSYMTDEQYNKDRVDKIIYDFMEKRYTPEGKGGLFYVPGCKKDMTTLDIWSQMFLYLEKFDY